MPAFPPKQLIRYDSPLQKDSTITFRIGVNWFYKNWILRVSEFEPMSFFTDEQVNGPFLLWRHRHEFKTIENNTEIKDELEIDYRMITFLKPLVNGLLRMILSQIFKMRYIKTSKILV
jgi:ligand-binding SRPBCC domain-containing protein